MRQSDVESLSYEEKLAKLTRIYQRKKVRLALLHILLAGGYLLVMLFFFANRLKAALIPLADRFSRSPDTAMAVLFTFFFFLFYRLVSLPLHYYSNFKIEHTFMLSRESFGRWLARDAKTFALSQVVIIVLVAVFYYFLRTAGTMWWVYAAGAYIVFGVIVARIFPVLVFPLFYRKEPLPHKLVVERLKTLAEEARFKVSKVFSFDLSKETRKATAALAGWGRNRQILISDTLLSHFSVDEIEAVFAHELGHHARNHYLRMFVAGTLLTVGAFYVAHRALSFAYLRLGYQQLWDIATLPLFCLVLAAFAFVVRPLFNWYSRKLEMESDDFAVRASQTPGSFVQALEKLSRTNLENKKPGKLVEFFFYDHPPISKRIARARALEEVLRKPGDQKVEDR